MPHSYSLNRSLTILEPPLTVLATAPRRESQPPSAARRPIAVLDDGSEAALNASGRAALIAQYFGAPVRLLAARPSCAGAAPAGHATGQMEHRAVAGAGLLVTHLEAGCRPSEWLWGSRIEQLVRRFSIPVLIVKQPASRPYGRVLVGVKLDARASELIAVARTLAPHAQVNSVHVLGTSHEYRLRLAGAPEAAVRGHCAGAYGDAYRQLNDLIRPACGLEAASAPQLVVGNAPHRLLEMGGAARAGLIVLGKRPRHWLADLFLDRGVARTVLAEARSDVLLVPSK